MPVDLRSRLARGTIATVAEQLAELPGDDLTPRAIVTTHAITIEAPVAAVWPWIVQMGCDRAGWYAVDRLDNGGRPSSQRIMPEFQHLAQGDPVPGWPGHRLLMRAAVVRPEEAFVLHWQGKSSRLSWSFCLTPDGDRTRLVTRLRSAYRRPLSLGVRALLPGHDVMQGLQLHRIRERAERQKDL